MENSQLVLILQALDKKECRELRKWLQSPSHNQREDVVALFDYLTAGNHLQEAKFLQKERVFRRLFPGREYDDAQFRQTVHFLVKATEDFLTWQEFNTDMVQARIALASNLRRRNLDQPFQKVLRQADRLQVENSYRNEHFFRNEYLMQHKLYEHMTARQRTTELNLQQVVDALDKSYLIEKMQLCCYMLFHQTLYRATYTITLLHELLAHVEQHRLYEEPVIGIYYYILRAITEQENQEHFERLRRTIRNHGELVGPAQLREVYLMTINYCINKINAGIRAYRRECFEWYRQGFEESILVVNNQITRFTYLNAVLNALQLREFDWADQFMEAYKSYLEPRYRDSINHFCRARLLFEKGDFDACMGLLVQVEYDDYLINLNAKSMLMKIYYEQEEHEPLESLLESTRTYLKRKHIMGYHRTNYQNIIRYLRKLVKLNPFDKTKRLALRQEIEQAKPLTEREWLLEQIDRL